MQSQNTEQTHSPLTPEAHLAASVIALFPTGVEDETLCRSLPMDQLEGLRAVFELKQSGLLMEGTGRRLCLCPPAQAEFGTVEDGEQMNRIIQVALESMRARLAEGYPKIYTVDHPKIDEGLLGDLSNIMALSRLAMERGVEIDLYELTVQVSLYARVAGVTQEEMLWLEEAEAYYANNHQKYPRAMILLGLGNLARSIPDLEKAGDYYQRANTMAAYLCHSELAAVTMLRYADVLRMKGQYQVSLGACEASKLNMESLPAAPLLLQADIMETMADTQKALGRWSYAITEYDEARSIYATLEAGKLGEVNTLQSSADAYVALGNLNEARLRYQRAWNESQAIGDWQGQWNARLGLANVDRLDGEYAKAAEAVETILEGYTKIGDKLGFGNALLLKSRIYRELVQKEIAVEYAQKSQAVFEEIGCPMNAAIAGVEFWRAGNLPPDDAVIQAQMKSFMDLIGRELMLYEINRWPLEKKGGVFLVTEATRKKRPSITPS